MQYTDYDCVPLLLHFPSISQHRHCYCNDFQKNIAIAYQNMNIAHVHHHPECIFWSQTFAAEMTRRICSRLLRLIVAGGEHFEFACTVLGVSNVTWWLIMSYTGWECCSAEFQHKMDHLDTKTEFCAQHFTVLSAHCDSRVL